MRGIRDVDAHERRGEQSLDLCHRGHETELFGLAQRFEHRAHEGVAASIEHGTLGEAGLCEPRDADSTVRVTRLDRDEAVGFERAQQPRGVAGVQVEPAPQLADVTAFGADLPEHPRLAEGTVAREVVVVECADALRHEAVEAAHSVDGGPVDSLTLVRESESMRLELGLETQDSDRGSRRQCS